MHPELSWPWDASLLRRRAALRAELLAARAHFQSVKIAILGGSTTNNIRDMLELFLLDAGLKPEFYESEYGQYWQDAMFPPAALTAFAPDIIYIHTTLRNLQGAPTPQNPPAAAEALLEQEYSRFAQMWQALLEGFSAQLVQNNLELPPYRLMGNKDASDARGLSNFATRLNQKFYDFANENPRFFIHDGAWVAADCGLANFSDSKYWHMFKYSPAPTAVPAFAASLSHLVLSLRGLGKKALSLDLDNTLWGGLVGEEGQSGIEIGHETPMGEVYGEFQRYIKAHKALGVVLTVNSKNDEANALEGLNHPEGELRPEDFAVIGANWEPKDHNLLAAAQALALGPDSFVFVDDNPAEREMVRQGVPGAAVVQFAGVENTIPALDHAGYFELTTFSADDAARAEMYAQNARRASQQQSFADYGEYLKSLEMTARIAPFEPLYLPRIAQLTNKSNQFNLTTLRCTAGELEAMMADPASLTLYGKLADKFGDNGLVSVVAARPAVEEPEALDIILWLMSCRVLKRGMEDAMMDALVARALAAGAKALRGHYYKTAKNAMVKDFYSQYGFEKLEETENGDSHWRLQLAAYAPKKPTIKVESE